MSTLNALIHSYLQESCCRLLDQLEVLEDSSWIMSLLSSTVKTGLVVVLWQNTVWRLCVYLWLTLIRKKLMVTSS